MAGKSRTQDRRKSKESVAAERRRLSDRRNHERVLVNIEVDYACDDTFLFAYITDLSAMGIFIQTRKPRPPGTRLNLRFHPPGGPEINAEGLVMWINPYRPGHPDNLNPGMGVQFVDLDPAQHERVLKLVKTFAYLDDEDDGPPTRGNS